MMTVTGEYITLSEGAPSLEALALGVSRQPRFAGQTLFDWHVSDHLIVCARIAQAGFPGWPDRLQLHAALHDAHEALTGDAPVPLKTPDMKVLQGVLDGRIYEALQIDVPTKVEANVVKVIDEEALLAEASIVVPKRTYDKIVWERGHAPNPAYVAIVEEVLFADFDSKEVWYQNVRRLVNQYARTPTVCDPILKVAQ